MFIIIADVSVSSSELGMFEIIVSYLSDCGICCCCERSLANQMHDRKCKNVAQFHVCYDFVKSCSSLTKLPHVYFDEFPSPVYFIFFVK